jgi:hypothetical protein
MNNHHSAIGPAAAHGARLLSRQPLSAVPLSWRDSPGARRWRISDEVVPALITAGREAQQEDDRHANDEQTISGSVHLARLKNALFKRSNALALP